MYEILIQFTHSNAERLNLISLKVLKLFFLKAKLKKLEQKRRS